MAAGSFLFPCDASDLVRFWREHFKRVRIYRFYTDNLPSILVLLRLLRSFSYYPIYFRYDQRDNKKTALDARCRDFRMRVFVNQV